MLQSLGTARSDCSPCTAAPAHTGCECCGSTACQGGECSPRGQEPARRPAGGPGRCVNPLTARTARTLPTTGRSRPELGPPGRPRSRTERGCTALKWAGVSNRAKQPGLAGTRIQHTQGRAPHGFSTSGESLLVQARLTAQGPDTYYQLFTKQLYHTRDQQATDNSAREFQGKSPSL